MRAHIGLMRVGQLRERIELHSVATISARQSAQPCVGTLRFEQLLNMGRLRSSSSVQDTAPDALYLPPLNGRKVAVKPDSL
jgi:hypothetical protein